MFQRLNQLTQNRLAESSNMVESKYMSGGQTHDSISTYHSNASHLSIEKIVTELKNTIQQQEKKIFDYQITLRKHQLNLIELQKVLQVQKDYAQQLKNQLNQYKSKQLSQYSENELKSIVEENKRLRDQIQELKKMKQIPKAYYQGVNESRASSDSFEHKFDHINQLQLQLHQVREQLIKKQAILTQKFMKKQEKMQKKLKIMLRIIQRFYQLFSASEDINQQLLLEIQQLRPNFN